MSHPRTGTESVESSEGSGRKVNWLTPATDYVKLRVHGLLNLEPETKEAVKHLSHRQIKAIGKNNILQNFSAQEIKRLAKIPAGFIKKHIDTIVKGGIHITDEKAGMLGDSEVYSQISDFPLHLIFSPLGQTELLVLANFKKAELEEMMKGVNKDLIEPTTVTESKVSFILETLLDGVPKRNKTEFLGTIGFLALFGANEQTLITVKGLMGEMSEVETGKHIEVPLDTDGETDIDQDSKVVTKTKVSWEKNRKQMKKIKALDTTALVGVDIPDGTLEAIMKLTPEVISALGSVITQATPEQLMKFQKNIFSRYMYGGYEKLIQVFYDNFKSYDLIQCDKSTFKAICAMEIEQVEQLISCIERLSIQQLGYLKKMSAGSLQYLMSYLGQEGVINLDVKTLKKLTTGWGNVVTVDELEKGLAKLGIERVIIETDPNDEEGEDSDGSNAEGVEGNNGPDETDIEVGENDVFTAKVNISKDGRFIRFEDEKGKIFYKEGTMLGMIIGPVGIKEGELNQSDNVRVELKDGKIFKILKVGPGIDKIVYQKSSVSLPPPAKSVLKRRFEPLEVSSREVEGVVKLTKSKNGFRIVNAKASNEIFTEVGATDLVISLDDITEKIEDDQEITAIFSNGELTQILNADGEDIYDSSKKKLKRAA